MTDYQMQMIRDMRSNGEAYADIAEKIGASINTVKSFCRRHDVQIHEDEKPVKKDVEYCAQCGSELINLPGHKKKRFCSSTCKTKYWNAHADELNMKSAKTYTCPCCSMEFKAYGKRARKYCSHHCYIEDRFGGEKA